MIGNLTNNVIEHICKMMTVGTITTKLRKLHSDRIEFGVLIVKTNSVTNSFNHLVNGECQWFGENRDDVGVIIVKNNIVTTKVGKLTYG